MKTFKEYYSNKLDEISLSSLISLAKKKVKSLFTSLGFGKKVIIHIPVGILAEETIDTKSRLGYLAEYATAAHLADEIKANGGRIDQSLITHLHQEYKNKKAELENLQLDDKKKQNLHQEILRMDSAGVDLAKKIFSEIVLHGEDFNLLQFDIQLTGDSEKGLSKADLKLIVYKDSKDQVIDQINASLKAYKTSTINLANPSFVSLFKALFYDGDAPDKIDLFIEDFVKKFGSNDELMNLYKLQTLIKDLTATGISKDDARKLAKKTHPDVIAMIVNIFHSHYDKHKKQVNERMLKLLGFDSDEDFYAAIGKAGKQKVISSRSSVEFKKMIQTLSADFTITIKRNGQTSNAEVKFISPNKEVILTGTLTFADSGGKSASGKVNYFVDFKRFME